MAIYKTKLSHFVGAAYLLLFANDVNGFTTVMRTTTTTHPPFSVVPTIVTSKKITFPYSYQNQKKHNRFRSTCIRNSNTDDNNEMSQIDVDRKSFLQEIETSMECMDSNNTKKKRRLTNLASSKRGVNVQDIHPFLHKAWKKVKSSFQKPARKATSLIAAACIMFFVIFAPLTDAFAATSGGRMGGSFGGSSRGSGGSSYSRSYSSPSRSSYNRGYTSQGYSGGYYSRPSITVMPSMGNHQYNYSPSGVAIRRGPSVLDVVASLFFVFVIINAFQNATNNIDDDVASTLGAGVTVAQISVALNVPDKDSSSSILTYLNRLSQTARTDSRVGVANLVSQVALELLRQKRSVFAANSKYTHHNSGDKAQRDYSSIAINERSKFEKESISKYGGVDYAQQEDETMRASLPGDSYSPKATAAVVTIILSIDGDSTKLPMINSPTDLQKALVMIASDVKVDDCLRSAEVLWTPEDGKDTLSERDVIVDYPELRSI